MSFTKINQTAWRTDASHTRRSQDAIKRTTLLYNTKDHQFLYIGVWGWDGGEVSCEILPPKINFIGPFVEFLDEFPI